jgi:hypothetical protein
MLRHLKPFRHTYLLGGGISGALVAGVAAAFIAITALVSSGDLPDSATPSVVPVRPESVTLSRAQPGGPQAPGTSTEPPGVAPAAQPPAPIDVALRVPTTSLTASAGPSTAPAPSIFAFASVGRAAATHHHALKSLKRGTVGAAAAGGNAKLGSGSGDGGSASDQSLESSHAGPSPGHGGDVASGGPAKPALKPTKPAKPPKPTKPAKPPKPAAAPKPPKPAKPAKPAPPPKPAKPTKPAKPPKPAAAPKPAKAPPGHAKHG